MITFQIATHGRHRTVPPSLPHHRTEVTAVLYGLLVCILVAMDGPELPQYTTIHPPRTSGLPRQRESDPAVRTEVESAMTYMPFSVYDSFPPLDLLGLLPLRLL